MIKFYVGVRKGPNNEALVVVSTAEPSGLVNVRRITARDRDVAAQLYVEQVMGGKAAMRPKGN